MFWLLNYRFELGCSSVGRVTAKKTSSPSLSPALTKLDLVAYTCNPPPQEVEAGGSKAQGCPWLHYKFEACLDYIRPHLKNQSITKKPYIDILNKPTSLDVSKELNIQN